MRDSAMSQLDSLREELAYLKLWLGVFIVTAISVAGWLIANFDTTEWPLRGGAMILFAVLAYGCFVLDGLIRSKISDVRRL